MSKHKIHSCMGLVPLMHMKHMEYGSTQLSTITILYISIHIETKLEQVEHTQRKINVNLTPISYYFLSN